MGTGSSYIQKPEFMTPFLEMPQNNFNTIENGQTSTNSANAEVEEIKIYKPIDGDVINDVLAGKYGNGQERRDLLYQAGYDPKEVQEAINESLGINSEVEEYIPPENVVVEPENTTTSDNTDNVLIDSNGEISIEIPDAISIFDEANIENGYQYGANQYAFSTPETRAIYLNDEFFISIMEEYFPELKEDPNKYEKMDKYLELAFCRGCAYVSVVNIIFKEYEGREEEFKNIFGFDMYKTTAEGNLDFNYEYLFITFLNYMQKNTGYSFDELCGWNWDETKENDHRVKGSTPVHIKKFMSEKYGINVESVFEYDVHYLTEEDYNTNAQIQQVINDFQTGNTDTHYVLMAFDGYVYRSPENLENFGKGNAHAMYITGVTDDGQYLIVSTWGSEKYISIDELGGHYYIGGYKFS